MAHRTRISTAPIPSCCLTPEQKETLINAVKERPAIWDTSSDDYNDGSRRRRAYAEVAEILSDDNYSYKPAEIQIEWKKLRDVFNRTLKKVLAAETSHDVCWRYWEKMQFIAPPEQLLSLRMKMETEPQGRSSVDILQRLVESSLLRENEECLFVKDDDVDTKPLSSLEWLSQNCAQAANECTDNESSSPKTSNKASPKHEDNFDDSKNSNSDDLEPLHKRKRPYFKSATRVLPSIPASTSSSLQSTDTFATFGAFVASHLRAISAKNKVNGIMLKRELMELCLKYELDNL
uniref:MADF domain-containing protein n=1 Tax=Bursaphelenchus xylophilus TaxID=6326 RepID=A0A1I7S4F8_BURXY